MNNLEFVDFLNSKTLKARTKLASKFVREVVEHSVLAANIGENHLDVDCLGYFNSNGYYPNHNEYVIICNQKMNHEHAEKVLQRIGFEIELVNGKISKIYWS